MVWAYNTEQVSAAIERGEDAIEAAVTSMVDGLIDHSAIRIHSAWGVSNERKLIIQNATRLAVLSVLTCDWSNLDDEAKWLHIDRADPAKAAAQ